MGLGALLALAALAAAAKADLVRRRTRSLARLRRCR